MVDNMVLTILLYAMVIFGTFLFMEGTAWFLHKYVMHGFGWVLHEDHHHYKGRKIQKNDLYSLFFSGLAIFLLAFGAYQGYNIIFYFGIGVTLYGVGYFGFHDILFHRRLIKLRYKAKSRYMKRIFNAHRVHHAKSSEHEGVAFGFLYASKKYDVKE